jgi:hypothetical protein
LALTYIGIKKIPTSAENFVKESASSVPVMDGLASLNACNAFLLASE